MNANIKGNIKETARLENDIDKDTYQEFSRKWPFYLFFHMILHPFSGRKKRKRINA